MINFHEFIEKIDIKIIKIKKWKKEKFFLMNLIL